MHAKQKDALQSSSSATPPWLLNHARVNFDLHCFHQEDTPPEIFESKQTSWDLFLLRWFPSNIHWWFRERWPSGFGCCCQKLC